MWLPSINTWYYKGLGVTSINTVLTHKVLTTLLKTVCYKNQLFFNLAAVVDHIVSSAQKYSKINKTKFTIKLSGQN